MPEIVLSEISGKIIGYELGDEDGEAILKVKDENGKVQTAHATLGENESIPSGNVRIVTTIEFEEKKRATDPNNKNYLFGNDGSVLIDPETGFPFKAKAGPTFSTTVGDKIKKPGAKRKAEAQEKHGGAPLQALTLKLKKAFAASKMTAEQWNEMKKEERIKLLG